MSKRLLFNDNWRFFNGEGAAEKGPYWKGPAYIEAKTERYRRGPASIQYLDYPNDFGMGKDGYADREITYEYWESITLPHDYIISQEPKKSGNVGLGYFDYHPAWYRKHFTVGEEYREKRIVIYFEGVTQRCEVFLNGIPMYESSSGFVPFEIDITDFVRFGEENVLAVHVIPTRADSWWYAGAGIYRDVYLEISEKVAAARYGTYLAPEKGEGDTWHLPCEVEIENSDWCGHNASVTVEIFAPNGEKAAEMSSNAHIEAKECAKLVLDTAINSPMLWDIDSPMLYTVKTTVKSERGEDESHTTFGFRTIRFDSEKGFFLNEKNIKIKGVCGHGDFGLSGKAVPDNIHRLKVRLIKEMGANGYRCSHYPQSEYLMDEFDRQGIVVMAESRWFTSTKDGIDELTTLVKRDRNHPTVIMWSVGNEEEYFVREQGARIVKTLRNAVLKYDKSRAIMTANDKKPDVCTVYDDSDIVGVNYNLGMFDMLHEKFPDKGILSTECCATGTTRGWYYDNSPEQGYVTAYDKGTNAWFMGREKTWRFIHERPWLMGSFQWISFDHRGEAAWPRLCSQSGAMDMFLQKKDAFYQNQTHWRSEPIVHLLPHWNHRGKEGKKIEVWAYTNCQEVELFLNGVSLGRQSTPYPSHGEWMVEYVPGKLEAVGYQEGREVCRDIKETTGRAVELKLEIMNGDDVRANGKDIALFRCLAVDEIGREVPDASAFVRFNSNRLGQIVGTGSSPSDHVPVPEPNRQMFMGIITVAVKVGQESGILSLAAESDTLDSAYIEMEISK